MKNTITRDTVNAARVHRVAEMAGVSKRYVRMVIKGKRENEQVLRAYMELAEGENALLEAVKELVPFK